MRSEIISLSNSASEAIWGVFCGIKGNFPILKKDELPYADCNKGIWTKPDQFFLQQSEIEIICFDGSYTILKFRDKQLEDRFKEKFTDAQILIKDQY